MNQQLEKSAIDVQLDLLRSHLQEQVVPGYPEPGDRLVMRTGDIHYDALGRLALPDGPWTIGDNTAEASGSAIVLEQDHLVDTKGRPLHPWFTRMIADPALGVVLGKANYYEWGKNPTADGVVFMNNHVLLIRRRDTGEWALPGGYLNFDGQNHEPAEDAMVREIAEEANLHIPKDARITQVYEGPVADIRATANAWPETTAFAIRLASGGPLPEVRGLDDAAQAMWFPLDLLRGLPFKLFGSHNFLLAKAIEAYDKLPEYLDLSADSFTEALKSAPIYAKKGMVRARPAIPGEIVITRLADGTEETRNVATDNHMVITNPGGEEYLIGNEKFGLRYAATEIEGVYKAKGLIRAITNPTGRNIEIVAPWGEVQVGGPDCKIGVAYYDDRAGIVEPDRYLIADDEFQTTYGRRGKEA